MVLLLHRLLHCQTRSNPHHRVVCALNVEMVHRRRGTRHLRREGRIGRRIASGPRDVGPDFQIRDTLIVARSLRPSLLSSSPLRSPFQTLRRHPFGRETTVTAQFAERRLPVFVGRSEPKPADRTGRKRPCESRQAPDPLRPRPLRKVCRLRQLNLHLRGQRTDARFRHLPGCPRCQLRQAGKSRAVDRAPR